MPNYQKGKIYTLRSPHTEAIYIGSTCNKYLCNRLSNHKRHYKRYLSGKGKYITSYELLKYDDCYIELLEECPCENREQLHKREGQLIRETPNCVNICIPGRSKAQYYQDNKEKIREHKKKYREENKEKIRRSKAQYYQDNKEREKARVRAYRLANIDKIKQKKAEKVVCELCDIEVSRCHMARHRRSKRHLNNEN